MKLGSGAPVYFSLILLLLDAEDVRRALDAGEQVLAVVAVEEFAQRLDAADDQHQVVLAFEEQNGIDQIVPRALLAQLDPCNRSPKKASKMSRLITIRPGSN